LTDPGAPRKPLPKGGVALVLALVFAIASVVFGIAGAVQYVEATNANVHGVEVTGVAVEVHEERRRINHRSRRFTVAEVEYRTADGTVLTTEFSRRDNVGRDSYEVGEEFELVYSADDPSRVVLAGDRGFVGPIANGVIGGVFLVLTAVLAPVGMSRLRRERGGGRPHPEPAG